MSVRTCCPIESLFAAANAFPARGSGSVAAAAPVPSASRNPLRVTSKAVPSVEPADCTNGLPRLPSAGRSRGVVPLLPPQRGDVVGDFAERVLRISRRLHRGEDHIGRMLARRYHVPTGAQTPHAPGDQAGHVVGAVGALERTAGRIATVSSLMQEHQGSVVQ